MELGTILTYAALFTIGGFAGFSYCKSKMMVRINNLKRRIDDLKNPVQKEE